MRQPISFVTMGLLCVITAAVSVCGVGEIPPKPVSNWVVNEARAFDEFDLFWLGDSYKGLPLMLVTTHTDSDGVRHVGFSYGELSYFGDGFSGSWRSSLEIDVQPYCGYLSHEFLLKEELEELGVEPESSGVVRIGDALGRVSHYDYWHYLGLFTGPSYIDVSTNGHADFDIEQAASDLIAITRDSDGASKPLPPPISSC